MTKFINSREAFSSSLSLWNDRPTQVAVEEVYDLKVWPVTNILNEGPINFVIPPQPKGLMDDVHIVTKFKIEKANVNLGEKPSKNISVVNNFANSLWGNVDVQFDDRVDIMQSMRNSYPYISFFNHALNSDSEKQDYLFYNELFKMDQGRTKTLEESSRTFWYWNVDLEDEIKEMMDDSITGKEATLTKVKSLLWKFDHKDYEKSLTGISIALGFVDPGLKLKNEAVRTLVGRGWLLNTKNLAASERSARVNRGQSLTVDSKLQCPIFNTSKTLPPNMKIRISLTKNSDGFLLLTEEEGFKVVIEDCYLNVTFVKAHEAFLKQIEERIKIEPVPYFIERPEIVIKPITSPGKIIRLTEVFQGRVPPYAFFALQKSKDFEGSLKTNPYSFIPFKKFQFYLNGKPYFNDPLDLDTVHDLAGGGTEYMGFGQFLRQLYKTLGKDLKGDCLVNSKNFNLNFMVGISFGADKSSVMENHMNIQEKASTYLEIDMGINKVPEDMLLVIYALYDRQIKINENRGIEIIE